MLTEAGFYVNIKIGKYIMERLPSVGETVRVTSMMPKDLEDDRVGVVYAVDGEYIYVRLAISGVEIERYRNELEIFKVKT